jgi:cob(I)alamin adenosyltransferase
MNKLTTGLIQIYTGNGKGKTTAAIGLAARATSRGLKIAFFQFLKARHDEPAVKMIPDIHYQNFGVSHEKYGWLHKLKPDENPDSDYIENLKIYQQAVQQGWIEVKKQITAGKFDLIVLDELNLAFFFDLLSEKEVVKTLTAKPKHTEIVITGRQAPKKLLEIADLVTEMQEIKHPYQKGISAREGIDF